jgi:hypothetical protein
MLKQAPLEETTFLLDLADSITKEFKRRKQKLSVVYLMEVFKFINRKCGWFGLAHSNRLDGVIINADFRNTDPHFFQKDFIKYLIDKWTLKQRPGGYADLKGDSKSIHFILDKTFRRVRSLSPHEHVPANKPNPVKLVGRARRRVELDKVEERLEYGKKFHKGEPRANSPPRSRSGANVGFGFLPLTTTLIRRGPIAASKDIEKKKKLGEQENQKTSLKQ